MKKKISLLLIVCMFLCAKLTVNAFSIQSYISAPSEYPTAVGYVYTSTMSHLTEYHYTNTSCDSSKYVIFRNAVKDGNKSYDLVVYPYYHTAEALMAYSYSELNIRMNSKNGDVGDGGYKLVVTEHVDSGIGSAVSWSGIMGFADLDYDEYVILPCLINTSQPVSHIGRNVSVQNIGSGYYKYRGIVNTNSEIESYDYNAISLEMTIPASGLTIYYGMDSTPSRSMYLSLVNMKQYIEQTWPKYNVTYIDVDEYGNELGRKVVAQDYTAEVRGFDIGDNMSDNAYYNTYKLKSDTSDTVTNSGAVVYRIFEKCIFDIEGSVYWVDKNDKLGLRPDEVTINIYQDGELLNSVVVDAFNGNMYSFNELPIYRTDGTKYEYTVEEIIPAVYGSDGTVYDAYKINTNMPEDYNFTNIIQFPGVDSVDIITNHKTDVVVKTNLEEKVPVQLTPTELFIDEELDISYGELKDNPINIFTDNIGEAIKNIPPGKYEISVDSYYDLEDISISDNENVYLQQEDGKWYLIVESTPEDGFGIIHIELYKNKDKYQDVMRIQNYFAFTDGI